MDLIQPRRIISHISAIDDLSLFLAPSVEEIVHPFDVLHDARARLLVGGNTLYKVRIEYRIAFSSCFILGPPFENFFLFFLCFCLTNNYLIIIIYVQGGVVDEL